MRPTVSAIPSRSLMNIGSSNTTSIWNARRPWCRATGDWGSRNVSPPTVRYCSPSTKMFWQNARELCRLKASKRLRSVFFGDDPAHEERARDVVSGILPDVAISISSEICPEIREYERMSTVCANAYVQPRMSRYLGHLESGLANRTRLPAPPDDVERRDYNGAKPHPDNRSGWSRAAPPAAPFSPRTSRHRTIRQSAVVRHGRHDSKITLIDDCEPLLSRSFEVARAYRFLKGSGLPLRIPVIEMVEIVPAAAGRRFDDEADRRRPGKAPIPDCVLRPRQRACDGHGRRSVLGRIEPATFAGGKIDLAPDKAETAITTEIATPLGLNKAVAAAGIDEIVNENMANAARVHAIEHGKDTADRTLVALGARRPSRSPPRRQTRHRPCDRANGRRCRIRRRISWLR